MSFEVAWILFGGHTFISSECDKTWKLPNVLLVDFWSIFHALFHLFSMYDRGTKFDLRMAWISKKTIGRNLPGTKIEFKNFAQQKTSSGKHVTNLLNLWADFDIFFEKVYLALSSYKETEYQCSRRRQLENDINKCEKWRENLGFPLIATEFIDDKENKGIRALFADLNAAEASANVWINSW